MEDCVFCKIVRGEIPIENFVYEDEDFVAFLDANPRCEGHTLVVPKKHFKDLLELDEETSARYISVLKKVGKILIEKYDVPAFNIFLNNGGEAGQAVWHVHFHILPRREGDSGKGIFID
jgi:histidine triad (HIT) family protein